MGCASSSQSVSPTQLCAAPRRGCLPWTRFFVNNTDPLPSYATYRAASPRASGRGAAAQPVNRGVGDPNNRRVKPSPPWAESTPLTSQQLAMKRASFWETATSGRPLTWSNLKLAAEAMVAGDYELASTVLDAADIRVPHADLSVAYDGLGNRYELPRHIYSNPTNILSDEDFQKQLGGGRGSRTGPREFSGPQMDIPLILRICGTQTSNEQDIRLPARSSVTMGGVKQALHEHLKAGKGDQPKDASVPRPNVWSASGGLPPARQRMMWRGREMADDVFLYDAGLRAEGATLQVFVRPAPA